MNGLFPPENVFDVVTIVLGYSGFRPEYAIRSKVVGMGARRRQRWQ
jgi:hypothetical protein